MIVPTSIYEGTQLPTTMKVFAGPPGTGKTYAAAREAVRIVRPDTPDATFADPEAFTKLHSSLVDQGVIKWVTFHPSYSYEDFVEGFRPHSDGEGNVTYSPMAGPFLQACAAATGTVDSTMFTIGQKLGPKENYEVTDVAADCVFLKSPKRGRNKGSFDINIVPFALIRYFDQKGLLPADLRHAGSKAKKAAEEDEPGDDGEEVAADADADGEEVAADADADGGDAPAGEGQLAPDAQEADAKHYDGRKAASAKTGLPITFFTNSSPHAAVLEHLHEQRKQSLDIVLVIDEMNRADLSKVLGELMTLLEVDKREGASERRSITLTYSQKPLSVPKSLHIVGTMNTADKSISSVDLAIRRRFDFVLVPPDPTLVPERYGGLLLRKYFVELNQRLAFLSGRDNLVGHADFMQRKLEDSAERERYHGDDVQLRAVAHLLRTKIVPFLLDLFRSDWSRVQSAVGQSLFAKEKIPDGLFPAEEQAELDDTALLRMEGFWNPDAPSWEQERFRTAMSRYLAPPPPAGAAPAAADAEPEAAA